MVIIWNDLACGDCEAAAVLVALNSVFQVVAFDMLGWFYLQILPGWRSLDTSRLHISTGKIMVNGLVHDPRDGSWPRGRLPALRRGGRPGQCPAR